MSVFLDKPVRAVSVGGGTGQLNTIRALRSFGCDITAIVSMVDDGGSTGILRKETGINPPGDIRKCLVAMAENEYAPLPQSLGKRFAFADNHAMGNLLLTALTMQTGSFIEAIQICEQILHCQGHVMPSTLDDIVLCGLTRDGHEFTGQATLGTGPCALKKVWISPSFCNAYEPAAQAILDADIVVLGPGSLFTSVIPNLLVPGILSALRRTKALKVYIASMADMQGETWGLNLEEYVDALLKHGLEGSLDVLIVHRHVEHDLGLATRSFQAITGEQIRNAAAERAWKILPNTMHNPDPDWYFRPVKVTDDMILRLEKRVPTIIVRDFHDKERPTWHNTQKLGQILRGVVESCRLPLR